MSKFGWSYPPGCSGTPFDEPDPPCTMCGKAVDDCICPECPECQSVGDPQCYLTHGLVRTAAQFQSLTEQMAIWEADNGVA